MRESPLRHEAKAVTRVCRVLVDDVIIGEKSNRVMSLVARALGRNPSTRIKEHGVQGVKRMRRQMESPRAGTDRNLFEPDVSRQTMEYSNHGEYRVTLKVLASTRMHVRSKVRP